MSHAIGVILRRNGFVQSGGRDDRKLRAGASEIPAGFEAAKYRQPPALARPRAGDEAELASDNWLGANRHGQVEAVAHRDAVKTWQRYAENGKWMPVERNRFANHVRCAAVAPLPERVAEVYAARAASLVVRRGNQPSEKCLHA